MHTHVQVLVRGLLAACSLALLLGTAGCPTKQEAQEPGVYGGGQQAAGTSGSGESVSLFAGTPFMEYPPQALDINRDGTLAFIKHYVPGQANTLVVCVPLTVDGLGPPSVVMESGNVIRNFVRAHPTEETCMLITHAQQPGGPVVDVIWKYRNQQSVEVTYDKAEGFPLMLKLQDRYNLEPFYSWDGEQIIVPLHSKGLCIIDAATNRGRFIPYPDLPGEFTGMKLGALPPKDGRNLAYISLWNKVKGPEEWCQISLLDLDSEEWLETTQLDWLVYNIASSDPLNEPWLVHGSRAPNKATEHNYIPRLALIDPLSGVVDLLMFYGTPYWPVDLDPEGRYVIYLDKQLEGISRLEPATGKLDIDKRFYHDEAKLFTAPGGDPVYVWHDDMLLRAEYTEHREFKE